MSKNKKRVTIFLSYSLLFVSLILMCSCNAFKNETVSDTSAPDIKYYYDSAYAINPSGVNVYDDNHAIIGNIPFLWQMDRIGKRNDGLSIISYNNENHYVLTSDISTHSDYKIKSYCFDIVKSGIYGTPVYSMPNGEYIDTIPKDWKINRMLDLDNGWSMISYKTKNVFAKTQDLLKRELLGSFQITYYCPCNICNGGWGAYDRYGNPLVDGSSAVDPHYISLGTSFEIEDSNGIRECVANDVGGAIKGQHIDVFVNVPHHVCENMGNTKKNVYIYIPCK